MTTLTFSSRKPLATFFVALLPVMGFGSATPSSATGAAGTTWTAQTSAADNEWNSVAYGNGIFVALAVAETGTGNRVMTSPDGINWTDQSSAADNDWSSVTYANGLFVAVARSGTGNRVITSGSFTPTTDTPLAATGANIEWVLFAGLIAVIAGSGFLAASSRRRV